MLIVGACRSELERYRTSGHRAPVQAPCSSGTSHDLYEARQTKPGLSSGSSEVRPTADISAQLLRANHESAGGFQIGSNAVYVLISSDGLVHTLTVHAANPASLLWPGLWRSGTR